MFPLRLSATRTSAFVCVVAGHTRNATVRGRCADAVVVALCFAIIGSIAPG